ncbi:MAG: dTDP-glucose 4,6-dehydratase [Acidiferrobacteraceae bacterium]|nr:dTDP-glucose 4,6-dehydratase [Acidiferrobacteraceae bacterium]
MDNLAHRCLFVTGGAGFIGSAVIRNVLFNTKARVVNIDNLTYAGNQETLIDVSKNQNYTFSKTNVCDRDALMRLFDLYRPTGVMHLAAESHVDRSIDSPHAFIDTNIKGTYTMLEVAREYLDKVSLEEHALFRFHHVSTDEVYGSLGNEGYFTEDSPYDPRSPYSASKAASDHLVRAWASTYGIPTLISNCSNNYGPYQYPEKLIPVVIDKAIREEPIPVYGSGENIRDWLYVDDHAAALRLIVESGIPGETYNVGGSQERTNLDVVQSVCRRLDAIRPRTNGHSYSELISFVSDRPGHDFRYAIDCTKLQNELGWNPTQSFESGLENTVVWYLDNQHWVKSVLANKYGGQRLGLGANE